MTMKLAPHEKTDTARDRIVSMEGTGVVLMPESLSPAVTPRQLRDRFSYLQSDKLLP